MTITGGQNKIRPLTVTVGLGFGLMIGFIYLYRSVKPSSFGQGVQVGQNAPEFRLKSLSGEEVQFTGLREKPAIINFWATWCEPCELEMPMLQDRYERYSKEFDILAINFAEPITEVQSYVERLGLTFDILLDETAAVQELYQVHGYPTTYIIDPQGKILVKHIGELTESQLDRYLAKVGVEE
jgi:peroxiredoxin